jgi:hypothetical protein
MLLEPEFWLELLENCSFSMLDAFSDWLFEGAPKPPTMLYETDAKKLGTRLKESTKAITHAMIIQR